MLKSLLVQAIEYNKHDRIFATDSKYDILD